MLRTGLERALPADPLACLTCAQARIAAREMLFGVDEYFLVLPHAWMFPPKPQDSFSSPCLTGECTAPYLLHLGSRQ